VAWLGVACVPHPSAPYLHRCFLNSAVQALFALPALRDHIHALAALWSTHGQFVTGSTASDGCYLGDAGSIVCATASAFARLASRVGPTHCHELHHFAIEQRWFRPCDADDSVMVVSRLLEHVTSLAALGVPLLGGEDACLGSLPLPVYTLPSVTTPTSGHADVDASDGAREECDSVLAIRAEDVTSAFSTTCCVAGHGLHALAASPVVFLQLLPSMTWHTDGRALHFDERLWLPCEDCAQDGSSSECNVWRAWAGAPTPAVAAPAAVPAATNGHWFVVRAVIAKSGGVHLGHFVTLVRQDVLPQGDCLWWLVDDERVDVIRRDTRVALCHEPCLREYMPCVLCCERWSDSDALS
jgi:hypothetical protein